MILFFERSESNTYYIINSEYTLTEIDLNKLVWLFGGAKKIEAEYLKGSFIGPRKEMITPWSTNAIEITSNMGINGIKRIEEFHKLQKHQKKYDPMLQTIYTDIDQEIFTINIIPQPILYIENIDTYNQKEGLALNNEEIYYLNNLRKKINRPLTDSEIFGFSQVNSEHCRHKIFNGKFIIDGIEQKESLFALIKKTTKTNLNRVLSAYVDNVAFIKGPCIKQFAPTNHFSPGYFKIQDIDIVLSLKAETHNFPTTVEPFYGASTGSGGEIRDRMAGGKASIPLAGTAVYMTGFTRTDKTKIWENKINSRKWLYHSPLEILIKASNGASDFGNKFGQPLICGSLLTFEHQENNKAYSYDKVIMLAGGIGYATLKDCLKEQPQQGDKIILLGGDNYRIGMGGGAVSSVATGEYNSTLELNAVQRANPEMQKRVFNTIRTLAESDENPIISIHDHGAGGHLNCLSELVSGVGGKIDIKEIPVGDPTLTDKEIIGNESQERMGLVVKEKDCNLIKIIAEKERAPFYIIGEITGDQNFIFNNRESKKPIDLKLEYLFGDLPVSVIKDTKIQISYQNPEYDSKKILTYIKYVLKLESVACKDWLTNKVDRSVTGKVAKQQTTGILQLPLNNLGVMALDYDGNKGIATSIGHAPVAGLIDSSKGSILSVAEALTNLIWAPLQDGLQGVSLSANWMWPCRNPGEDDRLYQAVKAMSDFAIALGINIPTGKDSLSMSQKYPDNQIVYSPGTVIVSTVGEVTDIPKIIEPTIKSIKDSILLYIDFSKDSFKLGGSSFCQIFNKLGNDPPTINDPIYFRNTFNIVQSLINEEIILAGHDISAGGLITTLLEMNFANNQNGMDINLNGFSEEDLVKILFNENPAVIIQIKKDDYIKQRVLFDKNAISHIELGSITNSGILNIIFHDKKIKLNISTLRDIWYKPSFLLDCNQSSNKHAKKRYLNYKQQPLSINIPNSFVGEYNSLKLDKNRTTPTGINAAIIREKGINGDREMAYSLYLAGFDVKDIHMTDLISGRETLEDISFIVFPGGFSNSDVLDSAKGWAGAFLYNEKAKNALKTFYTRKNTLSLGVCNGCQLMVMLDLIYPDHQKKPRMFFNSSKKFESAFLSVKILKNESILLHSLEGTVLGVWVAHGEGKFNFPYRQNKYNIPVKYCYAQYPGNPNGSDYAAAAICSDDGRHLAMMPHIERAIFPWQWGYYPSERKKDQITPWITAFINAKEWIKSNSI